MRVQMSQARCGEEDVRLRFWCLFRWEGEGERNVKMWMVVLFFVFGLLYCKEG